MLIHDNIGVYIVGKIVEINFAKELFSQQQSTSKMINRSPNFKIQFGERFLFRHRICRNSEFKLAIV